MRDKLSRNASHKWTILAFCLIKLAIIFNIFVLNFFEFLLQKYIGSLF
jgi:hypothetical protein